MFKQGEEDEVLFFAFVFINENSVRKKKGYIVDESKDSSPLRVAKPRS